MRAPRGQAFSTRLALPLRSLLQRFAYLLLIGMAFGLMLLGKGETVVIERTRAAVVDVVAPIMDAMSRPAATVARVVARIDELAKLRNENVELRGRNAQLLQWQEVARRLAEENRRLRLLLDYVPEPGTRAVSARVIADAGGVFVRSVLVAAGARDGVRKGEAAVTGEGMVGRVAGVGHRSARLLLITDLNSRLPVLVESTRARAILAGDNSPQPRLVFLPPNAEVSPGDRIITSGHGGVLPPGLPLGEVVSIGEHGIRVQPFVALDRLEYVRILDFSPPPPPESPTREIAREGAL